MVIHNAAITGSLTLNGVDISDITGSEASVGALNAFSSSILNFTSSTDARLTALNAQTSSILSYTASNDAKITALNAQTASILSYTSSNDAKISAIYTATSSLNESVSALNAQTASLLSYTSSTDAKISSVYNATSSLQNATSSLQAFSSSILSYTSSTDARVTGLNAFSSSILSYTSSTDAKITSIYSTTASLNAAVSSLNAATASLYTATSSLNASVAGLNLQTASLLSYTASTDAKIASIYSTTSSLNASVASLNSYTSSTDAKIASIYSTTASLNASVAGLNAQSASLLSYTASNSANVSSLFASVSSLSAGSASSAASINALNLQTASLLSYTSSNSANVVTLFATSASLNASVAGLNSYTSSLNAKTASFATTGSNTFTGRQYISDASQASSFTSTASLYTDGGLRVAKDAYISGTLFLNNLTVFGTQSVAYISSSQLNIATNIITVNTSTPSIRFGGLAVQDSGSTGLTGSILWDSQENHWVYSNPSGSSYSGGMFISGPRSAALGSEQGTTFNALMKGQGGDHITSSGIFESGSNVGIGTSSPASTLHIVSNSAARIRLVSSDPHASLLDFYNGSTARWSIGVDNSQSYGKLENRVLSVDAIRFYDSSNNVSIVPSAGSVGIGTTSPAYKLDVAGTLYASGTATFAGSLSANIITANTFTDNYITMSAAQINRGGGTVELQYAGAGDVRIFGNTAYPIVFTSGTGVASFTGNVGIGSTSPVAKLDVAGRVAVGEDLFLKRTDSDFGFITRPNSTGYKKAGFLVNGGGNLTDFYVYSDLSYFSGNVGIGTTSPSSKLDVRGAARIGGTNEPVVIGSYTDSYSGYYSVINSTNNGDITFASNLYNNNTNLVTINNHVSMTGGAIVIWGNGASLGANTIAFYNQTPGTATAGTIVSGSNAKMVIRNGNVGIGTTNPTSKLLVAGTLTATDTISSTSGTVTTLLSYTSTNGVVGTQTNHGLQIRTNDTTRMFIDTNGNVGIGTTSPASTLHVVGPGRFSSTSTTAQSANVGLYLSIGSSSNNYNGILFQGVSATDMYFGRVSGSSVDDLVIVGTSELVRFKANGSVGIGNTSPDAKLVIGEDSSSSNVGYIRLRGHDIYEGNIYKTSTYGLYLDVDSNARPIRIDGSAFITGITGNVGIGTTSPSYKLEVSGEVGINYTNALSTMKGGTGYSIFRMYAGDGTSTDVVEFQVRNRADSVNVTTIGTYSNHDIRFRTNNTDKVVINTNGNVGIGTTSPAYKLDIQGSSDQILRLKSSSANGVIYLEGTTRSWGIFGGLNSGNLTIKDETGNIDAITVASGGNVGIGTTSPAGRLDVRAGSGGKIIFGSYNANYTINVEGGDQFNAYNGGSATPMYIQYNGGNTILNGSGTGNVGIGIATAPTNKLQIGSTSYNGNEFAIGNGSVNFAIDLASSNTDIYSSAAMTFNTQLSERVRIAANGNVGIGSTSPAFRLDVADDGAVISGTATIGSNMKGLRVYNNTTATQNNAVGIWFSTGPHQAGIASFRATPDTTWETTLAFYTHIDTTSNLTDATEKMRITGNGSVGIGTTSPTSKLHVVGDGDTVTLQKSNNVPALAFLGTSTNKSVIEGGDTFNFYTGGSSRLHITNGGNVGIGTTSPSYILQTKDMGVGSSNAYFGTGVVRIGGGADAGSNQVLSLAPGRFGMDNPGVSNGRFVIEENGRVGIGIASPSSILHTYTTTNADNAGHIQYENGNTGTGSSANAQLIGKSKYGTLQLMVWENYGIRFGMRSTANGGAGDIYFTTGTDSTQMVIKGGNVGIGTTNPTNKLEISGQTYMNNGTSNALYINTVVADNTTRDAIYLYENSGQASGRQAISWFNGSGGGTPYYKARLWTEVGSGYNVTQFGIDVANNARTLGTRLYINNGDTYHSGDVIAYASDFRLKENITPIENALDKVQKISGVHYQWKDEVKELGFEPTNKQDIGVIAQAIQAVLPEAVKPAPFDYIGGSSKSGENYLTVQYEKIVPLLIEAIKELNAKIDRLENNK